MQILVLGMHRSGTSAVSRLLAMMGAFTGYDEVLMPPSDHNPKGYWERRDVQALNEVLFSALGVEWDRLARWGKKELKPKQRQWFERRLRLILSQLEPQRPWFVKDPRLCLLLPHWRPLLEVPVVVHVVRHPAAVARSLLERNGCPLPVGLALWELYTAEALNASSDLPRFFVSFDELISNPAATVNNLLSRLRERGVRDLELPSRLEIERFVDSDLDHHGQIAASDPGPLNKSQRALYEALEAAVVTGELSGPLPKLSPDLFETLETHESNVPANAEARERQLELYRMRLDTSLGELTSSDSLEARLDALRAERRRLSRELCELRSELRVHNHVSPAELEEFKTRLRQESSLLRFREWQVEDLSTRLKNQTAKATKLESSLEKESKQVEDLRRQLTAGGEEQSRLIGELEASGLRVAELEQQREQDRAQLESAQARIDKLDLQLRESLGEARVAQSAYIELLNSRAFRLSQKLVQLYDRLNPARRRRPRAPRSAVERRA